MVYAVKLSILSLLMLTACGQATESAPADQTTPPSQDETAIAPIKSGQIVIQYQIGDADPRDWTITPELSPDTLILECSAGETVPVTFTTDLETRAIPMSLEQDSLQFDILVNDDVTALTELKCIEEIVRYQGDFSSDRETAGDYAADIAPVLETYFRADGPGVILSITEAGDSLYDKAIGLDDIANQTPRQVEETFDIASVSKEFTAISILQLAEQGALSIDDPISKYFEDLPNGDQVTLHHLLTHTHGLPGMRFAENYTPNLKIELEAALEDIRQQEARFAPGEQYAYGNTPYYLLAMIVEQVSGLDRKTYVRENLFVPAGMTESFFLSDTPAPQNRVTAYNEVEGVHEVRTFDVSIGNEAGTGDIVSTLGDLRRWQRAVSNGTLISEDMFALASSPKTLNDGKEIARGYGFFRGTLNGELIIYNSGDFFTHTRHFYMPSRDLSIILNTNGTPQYDGGQSSIVWLQVLGKVFNRQTVEAFDEIIDLNDP